MKAMTLAEAQQTLQRIPAPADLMRVPEAAMLTGHHPETIRRRIRRGELRAWGRPLRVSLGDLLPLYIPHACVK